MSQHKQVDRTIVFDTVYSIYKKYKSKLLPKFYSFATLTLNFVYKKNVKHIRYVWPFYKDKWNENDDLKCI